jgi:hypothetical protein
MNPLSSPVSSIIYHLFSRNDPSSSEVRFDIHTCLFSTEARYVRFLGVELTFNVSCLSRRLNLRIYSGKLREIRAGSEKKKA